MTYTCDECGGALHPERDKANGRYRERCLPCIRDGVDITRHVDVCTNDDCIVCVSHAEERR